MMGFFKKFREHLNLAILGSVTVLFIFIMTFLLSVFPAHTQIHIWMLWLTIILSYAVCIVVYASLAARKEVIVKKYVPVLPKVRSICPTNKNSAQTFTFILESNAIYEAGSYVTIYHEDDNGKITQLGAGYVEIINNNGSPQVIMTHKSTDPETARIINLLGNHCVNAIKIRPYIPNYYKGEIFTQ